MIGFVYLGDGIDGVFFLYGYCCKYIKIMYLIW